MLLDGKGLVDALKAKVSEVECGIVKQYLDDNVPILFVDIREPNETEMGYPSQCELVPRGVLEMKITGLNRYQSLTKSLLSPSEVPIYLICRSGARSVLAADSLQQMGYRNVFSVAGGFLAWQKQGFSIESK